MIRFIYILFAFSILGCSGSKSTGSSQDGASPALEISEYDNKLFDAMTQMALGNLNKAYGFFQECSIIDPLQSVPFYEMARLDIKNQNISQAISNGEKAVTMSPENEWYHTTLALAYKEKADYDQAIKHYEKASELSPENREYYRNIITLNKMSGDTKKALSNLDILESKIGITEEVSFEKYDIHMASKKYDAAEKELNNLIDFFPQVVRYRGVLAEMFTEKGEIEKALSQYDIMKKMDPNNGQLHWQLALHYSSLGDDKNTYEEFKRSFSSTDVSLDNKIEVVRTYMHDDVHHLMDPVKVRDLLTVLSDTYPDNHKVSYINGDFYSKTYKYELALKAYEKAFELDQSSQDLLVKIVKLEYTMGEGNKLLESGTRGTELFPVQPVFYLFKSLGETSLGKYDDALNTLKIGREFVISDKELNALFYEQMGYSSYQNNDNLGAQTYYKKALELNTELSAVVNGNILFQIHLGKLDKAQDLLNEQPKFALEGPIFAPTKAYLLLKRDNLSESEIIFKQHLKNNHQEKKSLVMRHYGELLKAQGKTTEANEVWQENYRKANNPEVLKLIENN